MNKKLLAGLAPFALALPMAVATPASAAPGPGNTHRGFHRLVPRLACDITAYSTWRGNIRINIRVDEWGSTFGRVPLDIRVTDNWRTVAAGRVWTWLPYRDSGTVRDQRGPDRFTLTAFNPRTGERCWDSTTVWSGSRAFRVANDWVNPIL